MTHGVRESAKLDSDIQAYYKWLERTRECDRDSYSRYIEYESCYAWENRVTEKQQSLIDMIEKSSSIRFEGSTKFDASQFISLNSWRIDAMNKSDKVYYSCFRGFR